MRSIPSTFKLFLHHTYRHLLVAALLLSATVATVPVHGQSDQPDTVDAQSTVARVRERGNVLVVGVKQDFKPFGFRDENDELAGFDIDLVRAMADLWEVEIELVPVTSANRIEKLMAGEVDLVAASMTHTRPRDADIDFSQTYFLDGQSVLVRQASNITELAGLANGEVGAVEGSTSIEQIRQYAEQENVPLTVVPFPTYADAQAALDAGEIDALTTDRAFLLQTALDNPQFTVIGPRFTQEPYGMGVRSGDSTFRNLVDLALQQVARDGTYDTIYNTWFPGETPYQLQQLPGTWPYTFATAPDTWTPPSITRMAQIVQQRQLVVGVNYDLPPFGFLDESGKLNGFDVDLAREFARRWLGNPEAVELVRVTADSRIPVLAGGDVDLLIASLTQRQEWDEAIDFSQSYFLDDLALLVTTASGAGTLADLDGRRVGAVSGTTAMTTLQALVDTQALAIDVFPFQEHVAALGALEAGFVDAVMANGMALADYATDNPGYQVLRGPSIGEFLPAGVTTETPYAIGLANFDAGFRDLVNFTLQEMALDGAYDAIYAKWFDGVSTGVSGEAVADPFAIELWPGSSPRSSSIRLNNIAAGSAVTPQAVVATPVTRATPPPSPTPVSTPVPTSAAAAAPANQPIIVPTATSPGVAPTAAATPTSAPTPTRQPTPESGLYVIIPTEYGVFARTSTSTESESITLLPNETLYEAVGRTEDDTWIQVLLPSGQQAWVFTGVIAIEPAQLSQLPILPFESLPAATPTSTPAVTPVAAPIATPITPEQASDTVISDDVTPDGVRYVVQPGDYLALIAQEYYGDQFLWQRIYDANQAVIGPDPGVVEVGMELIIPPVP